MDKNIFKTTTLTDARILLVEDHDVLARALGDHLSQTFIGCLLWTVTTGEEAVENAIDYRPDVIVMDVGLPGMNGIEATKRILDALDTAKVIVWTLQPHPHLQAEALEAGAHTFLNKDCGPEGLTRAVIALLPKKRF